MGATTMRTRNRISCITVRGFKSIRREQSLAIRPLTILAGANSTGKSSFMQPLLLLKQTLDTVGDPGALLLDGPNVRFTMADQVLSRVTGKDHSAEFAVRVDLVDSLSIELVFQREQGRGFDLQEMVYREGKGAHSIVPQMSHEEIVKVLPVPWKTMHGEVGKGETGSFHWVGRRSASVTFTAPCRLRASKICERRSRG